jgi:hypothetical protein
MDAFTAAACWRLWSAYRPPGHAKLELTSLCAALPFQRYEGSGEEEADRWGRPNALCGREALGSCCREDPGRRDRTSTAALLPPCRSTLPPMLLQPMLLLPVLPPPLRLRLLWLLRLLRLLRLRLLRLLRRASTERSPPGEGPSCCCAPIVASSSLRSTRSLRSSTSRRGGRLPIALLAVARGGEMQGAFQSRSSCSNACLRNASFCAPSDLPT